jgi:hypothetical protein
MTDHTMAELEATDPELAASIHRRAAELQAVVAEQRAYLTEADDLTDEDIERIIARQHAGRGAGETDPAGDAE